MSARDQLHAAMLAARELDEYLSPQSRCRRNRGCPARRAQGWALMGAHREMREAGLIDRRRHLILYGETWDRYRHGRDDCLVAECTCEWSCTDAEDEAGLYRAVAAHLDGRGEAPRKASES